MMMSEMTLGVVVYGYIMVDVENRENEMIVDVRVPPSEMSVLLRLVMMSVQVVDEKEILEEL